MIVIMKFKMNSKLNIKANLNEIDELYYQIPKI